MKSMPFEQSLIDMSLSDRNQLKNRLSVLLQHLLKLRYAQGQLALDNARGWQDTVEEQRGELAKLFAAHPSLRRHFVPSIDAAYRAALGRLKDDYPLIPFPPKCDMALPDILGSAFATYDRG